jgi:serine/threonine protein kinase
MFGKTLGHYRILAKLGAGGMGEVYRAHDELLDRDVALKVLPAGSFRDPGARARLLLEARTASQLNHPNICTIHEVGEAEGQAYIAMELVEGQPLSARLAAGALRAEEIVRYGGQLAEALGHAHEHGVVHRDLKSANVVITADGRTKVLDFGLAKRLRGAELDEVTRSEASLTEPGTIVGTLSYMAPEQLRGQPADARSDIWAMGVMLYEMAVGVRPFRGRTGYELSSAILNEAPAPLPPHVPPGLCGVIERCLVKQPGERYQRAGEVRAALEAFQTGTASVPRPLRGYQWARRRWLAPAAAAALLLAVLGTLNSRRIRTRMLGASPQIDSLAVLPLENLSGDPAQDYLASGIHESLITELSEVGGFRRVIARSSVKRFLGTTMTPLQIEGQLGVDALLTGAVLRSGNRVQVTVHLINASGNQIWSEKYDRQFRDALTLDDEIVSAVTRELQLKLQPNEHARLQNPRPVDSEVLEAYWQGRFHRQKQTPEEMDVAERYFRLALEKDPNFAPAYAGLGMVWMLRGDAGFQAPSETFPKGAAFLKKAVAIDDSSAEVHVAMANYLDGVRWDWAGGEREFKRALELNPNLADAHFFYADLLLCTKRVDGWKREIQRARELDPLNDFDESFYGWHLNYLHRYDEAIPIFQKMLLTAPNKGSNYLGLWGAYYKKGMYREALAAAKGYFDSTGEHGFANALGTGRGEAYYRAAMRRVGEAMAAESKRRHIPAIRIARMFAHAGDKDRAMKWLERAYQAGESPLSRLAVFWDWDDLRSDPRFQDLLRRMNLPG